MSSLQGEKTVRTLPKTNQMLQRLLKSMPKPSSRRYIHESIPTKLRVKGCLQNKPKGLKVAKEDQIADRHNG